MADDGYNGWANYETWCMALWIDNTEGTYTYSRDLAKDAQEEAEENGNEFSGTAKSFLANALQAWQEEALEELTNDWPNTVYTDLLNSAFEAVDWYEIADSYLSELVES